MGRVVKQQGIRHKNLNEHSADHSRLTPVEMSGGTTTTTDLEIAFLLIVRDCNKIMI